MSSYEQISTEILQDYYQQNFPNDGQRFVAWYVRNIHGQNPNQTKYDVTDGAEDKQIDAVVIDDNSSTVYIVQGKFIGSKQVDAEPLREVLSSWLHLKDIIKLQETANAKLKVRLVDLSNALDDDYSVVFELITTASLTDSASKDLAAFEEQLAKDEDLPASLQVIDEPEIKTRLEHALEMTGPWINYELPLEAGKYLTMEVAGTKVLVAAVPLRECVKLPGIQDGSLFRRNVRQFMGLSNKVNAEIKSTIYSPKSRDFFFYHNGITAICNKLEAGTNSVKLNGLSVVNGCQSLNTLLACGEKVKQLEGTHLLFRFYEIPQLDRADKISTSTNFQSAVKPRDLRSNDRRVLNLKRLYEQRYSSGYFITKRGENPPAEKDRNYVVDLVDLGKWLMSWHSQRPNMAYSETRIFDKYFEQLFKREYDPENVLALSLWTREIMEGWKSENPFGLNESLLAMKAYAPFHVLYAISQLVAAASSQSDRVPSPSVGYKRVKDKNVVEQVVKMGATCVNVAIETANSEQTSSGKIFSPQNWVKTKTCLGGIKTAATTQLMMLPSFPNGKELKESLVIPKEAFEPRWEAD